MPWGCSAGTAKLVRESIVEPFVVQFAKQQPLVSVERRFLVCVQQRLLVCVEQQFLVPVEQ